jgi:hypothetical protein
LVNNVFRSLTTRARVYLTRTFVRLRTGLYTLLSRFIPSDQLIAKSPAILSSILNPNFKEGSHLDKKWKNYLLMKSKIKWKESMFKIHWNCSPRYRTSFRIFWFWNSILTQKSKIVCYGKNFWKNTESLKEVSINEEFKSYINIAYNSDWWQQLFNW